MASSLPVIDLSDDDEPSPAKVTVDTPSKMTNGLRPHSKGTGSRVGAVPANGSALPDAMGRDKDKVAQERNGTPSEESSPTWGEPLPPDPELVHASVHVSPRPRGTIAEKSVYQNGPREKIPDKSVHQNGLRGNTPNKSSLQNGPSGNLPDKSTHQNGPRGSTPDKTVHQNGGAENTKVRPGPDVKAERTSSPPLPTLGPENSDVCRLFWRAGDYEAQPSVVRQTQGAMDHVRVHPKFLHSNATSHKWALGAVAELLDNAVDEIANGATFVMVDKVMNPRDKTSALLIHDNGGGMTPDCMRQCMSLGYSRKSTNTTIGQYGNGFKTSTMRLGADVIVFSRCISGPVATQSIGLLSYTFLRKTGHEDVVVPMIDYELTDEHGSSDPEDGLRKIVRTTPDDWDQNLNTILEWSPFSTKAELLEQFRNIGLKGTKVLVYNLWYNDDGVSELDFDTDPLDIQLRGGAKQEKGKPVQAQLVQSHIANRYHHSLRVYASILYLQMPPGFKIVLRGQDVEHHSIANDLKFPQQIVYKPQINNMKDLSAKETSVITVIGFTKEAPLINVHGFNVYHKNRLIMPFWKVWQDNSSRGRGVVGVLEANFVEPAHDKQDFERTTVLLRLEARLKQMTVEYWNLHCHYIGYQPNTKAGKARKAAGPASLDYPSPLSTVTPTTSHGAGPDSSSSADLPSPGGPQTASVAMGLRSADRRSEAHQVSAPVKAEPMEVPERARTPITTQVYETLRRYKRQRVERSHRTATHESEGTEMDAETAVADAPFTTDESVLIQLVEENSQLLARIADSDLQNKNLEHNNEELLARVRKVEKELMAEKEQRYLLQREVEQLRKLHGGKPSGGVRVPERNRAEGGRVDGTGERRVVVKEEQL